jgi:A nuclease family of the HNH/ENDO VII superfamily with conserved AHH
VSKESNKLTSEQIYAAPIPNIIELTSGINDIAAADPTVNGYTLRNSIINSQRQQEICQMNGQTLSSTAIALQAQTQRNIAAATVQNSGYPSPTQPRGKNIYKKGYTVAGLSAVALKAEADLAIEHSAKLGRNFRVANPAFVRPDETDAHHIVAQGAKVAARSRRILFNAGIGVNDTDNCNVMPRAKTTVIPSMPNATAHQGVHTIKYHANVLAALLRAPDKTQQSIRLVLRAIKGQLNAGTFPY